MKKDLFDKVKSCVKSCFKEYDKFFYITVWAIFFKTIVYAATLQMNFVQIFSKTTVNVLLGAAAAGILLPAVLLFATKRRPLYFTILNIIITFVIIADTWFGRYYCTPLNLVTIFGANMDMIGTTTGSIGTLFKITDILYVIDFPIIIYLFIKRKKDTYHFRPGTRAVSVALAAMVSFFMLGGVLLNSDVGYYSQDNNYVTRNVGVVNFHLYDIGRTLSNNLINKPVYSDKIGQEVEEFFTMKNSEESPHKGPNAKFFAAEKGKNILIIQMEALQHFVIGLEIDGREVTPNLNKLLKDSIYFSNIYVQTAGGNTSDAEFLMNTSMYPAREGSVYARYNENTYASLPLLLKAQGYESNSFHANNAEFWSRDKMHPRLGFKKFYNIDDYIVDEKYGFDGSMLSDVSFYRQSLEHIDSDIKAPWYNFFISLSSHHPFVFFEDTDDFDAGEYEGTNIGNFLKAQNYSDHALGTLIDSLRQGGLYDDTLIVIYGDHTAVVREDQELLMELLGRENNEASWMAEQKIPLLIKGTNIDKGITVDTIGGQIDIMPTLANLLGLEFKYMMGRDLLNTDKNFVILRNGSFIQDNIYYMQSQDVVYDMSSGKMLNKKDFNDLIVRMRYPLKINDMMLSYDVLKYVEGRR